ncbi:hypothetical protein BU15DRAFT_64854 [Melanogaster broomeanus]|nr:hypothetical protein BU15DRAFT_64854 [Melanogaster broomeanus]
MRKPRDRCVTPPPPATGEDELQLFGLVLAPVEHEMVVVVEELAHEEWRTRWDDLDEQTQAMGLWKEAEATPLEKKSTSKTSCRGRACDLGSREGTGQAPNSIIESTDAGKSGVTSSLGQ